jgi:hypothetical protein
MRCYCGANITRDMSYEKFKNLKSIVCYRGFGYDQYQIYKSMEGILQATGIDGKACLLRTICEMQTNPIGEFTVVGEILTILLS